ncbi:MAG: sulfatase-like hydrolase/transferase, partial [Armatimonadota bacterium]|nr:sulfatase-like hydrolase/transferase [Armatimonadota bacterium]
VDQAVAWLRRHRDREKIFLWVDSFDPHEPWDPPPRFDRYAVGARRGPRLILPMGGPMERWASPDDVTHIRGLYAGEVSFVDHCLGRFFASLRELNYLDDSLVVVLADHGHPLGDHGKFLKGPDRLYSELLRVPFLVRLPRGRGGGRRSEALVQFQDLLPTVLDLIDAPGDREFMHGRSFAAVLRGETDEHREAIITGYHEGIDRCIRTRRYSYIMRPAGEADELYDLTEDPQERRNLAAEHGEEAERLRRLLGPAYRPRRRRGRGVQGKYELASSGIDEAVIGKH